MNDPIDFEKLEPLYLDIWFFKDGAYRQIFGLDASAAPKNSSRQLLLKRAARRLEEEEEDPARRMSRWLDQLDENSLIAGGDHLRRESALCSRLHRIFSRAADS